MAYSRLSCRFVFVQNDTHYPHLRLASCRRGPHRQRRPLAIRSAVLALAWRLVHYVTVEYEEESGLGFLDYMTPGAWAFGGARRLALGLAVLANWGLQSALGFPPLLNLQIGGSLVVRTRASMAGDAGVRGTLAAPRREASGRSRIAIGLWRKTFRAGILW